MPCQVPEPRLEHRHEAHHGDRQGRTRRLGPEMLPAADVQPLVLEPGEQRGGADEQERDRPVVDHELVGVERRRLQDGDARHGHAGNGEIEPAQPPAGLDEREPEQRPEGAQGDLAAFEARLRAVGGPEPELEQPERCGVGEERARDPVEHDPGGLDALDHVADEACDRALVLCALDRPPHEPGDEPGAQRPRRARLRRRPPDGGRARTARAAVRRSRARTRARGRDSRPRRAGTGAPASCRRARRGSPPRRPRRSRATPR